MLLAVRLLTSLPCWSSRNRSGVHTGLETAVWVCCGSSCTGACPPVCCPGSSWESRACCSPWTKEGTAPVWPWCLFTRRTWRQNQGLKTAFRPTVSHQTWHVWCVQWGAVMVPVWLWQSITGQLKGPHPLFTFPLRIHGSLCFTSHKMMTTLSFQSNNRRSALPTQQRCWQIAHPLSSPLPPFAFLLLSYQHHLARSGTQRAATPLLKSEACWQESVYWKGVCRSDERSLHSPAFSV